MYLLIFDSLKYHLSLYYTYRIYQYLKQRLTKNVPKFPELVRSDVLDGTINHIDLSTNIGFLRSV